LPVNFNPVCEPKHGLLLSHCALHASPLLAQLGREVEVVDVVEEEVEVVDEVDVEVDDVLVLEVVEVVVVVVVLCAKLKLAQRTTISAAIRIRLYSWWTTWRWK
jgi:hypothetical protein